LKDFRIVTIGGGTGAPIVLQALIKAGFSQINAICAATDSGGRTGIIRSDERDKVIAISDLLRSLIALAPTDSEQIDGFKELLSVTDSRNRNLGYFIYYALLEYFEDDFMEVQSLFEKVTGIEFLGCGIPVTLKATTLCFKTESGNIHRGEHELDLYAMSRDLVADIWLQPAVRATPKAIQAIKEATHIVYCPGSTYGSIIANFLPIGITNALKVTEAKKILITNLVSTRNETHEFKPINYWELFCKYTQLENPFDVLIAPNISQAEFEKQYPDVARRYADEHSYFLGWTANELESLQQKGVQIVLGEHYSVTKELKRVRHNSDTLRKVLAESIK
jgi:uncharacterized cofD-like protein